MTRVNNKKYLSLMATATGPGLSGCECHLVNEFIKGELLLAPCTDSVDE